MDLDASIKTYLPPKYSGATHRLGRIDHSGAITVRGKTVVTL